MGRSLLALYVAAVLGVASCAAGGGGPNVTNGNGGADPATLRYDFDGGLAAGEQGRYVDGERFDGRVRVRGGGGIEVVTGHSGKGSAVRFPEPCDGPACPQVILEIPDADALDPGAAPFSYGAAVLLERSDLTGGSNVVQKGAYGDLNGQWKLQVDKLDGRPSCVVQGRRQGQRTQAVVVADVGIADGHWHKVTCRKRDGYVAIVIDGAEGGRENVRVGTVSNDAPVRIGGKAILDSGDNDQFHGALDDVFLRVG